MAAYRLSLSTESVQQRAFTGQNFRISTMTIIYCRPPLYLLFQCSDLTNRTRDLKKKKLVNTTQICIFRTAHIENTNEKEDDSRRALGSFLHLRSPSRGSEFDWRSWRDCGSRDVAGLRVVYFWC